jgi:hypothetical protein
MAGYQAESSAGDPTRQVTVIADPGPARDRAMATVHAISAGVAATLAWRELAGAGALPVWPGVVLAEADGADDEELAAALPRLDAGAPLSRVVVALASAQIDVVAAMLFGAHVQLLCDARPADRVAALALATVGAGASLSDPARDAEAERLRRLGEELARIADAMSGLARDAQRRGEVSDRTTGYGAEPAPVATTSVTAGEVRGAIRSRRLRDAEFGPSIGGGWFEDPAWDMLLDLLAAELEGARVSVSSLCIAAAVAPTTALRWMARMSDAGLLRRTPDPADRRRAFVALSDTASAGIRRYCDNVRRAGLAIA